MVGIRGACRGFDRKCRVWQIAIVNSWCLLGLMWAVLLLGCRCDQDFVSVDIAKSEAALAEFEAAEAENKERKLYELIEAHKDEGNFGEVLKWSERYLTAEGNWNFRQDIRLITSTPQ